MEQIRRELTIDAAEENLAVVQEFVEDIIAATDCPMKTQMLIGVAVEEIFINIASYAYTPKIGKVEITAEGNAHISPVNRTMPSVYLADPGDVLQSGKSDSVGFQFILEDDEQNDHWKC